MAAFRYFVGDGTAYHPGIPARDLEQDEYDALSKHLQETVDTSPLYRKSKPRDETHAAPAAPVTAPAAKDEK